jgi:DNA-binding response OmpR family regulator
VSDHPEPRKRAIVAGFSADTANTLADMLTTGGFEVRYGRSAEYAALQARIQPADTLLLSASCSLGGTLELIAQLDHSTETRVIVIAEGNPAAVRPFAEAGISTRQTIPATCDELLEGTL